jgi:hypothetical protein
MTRLLWLLISTGIALYFKGLAKQRGAPGFGPLRTAKRNS